jgi:predicted metal-dependent hydrolase
MSDRQVQLAGVSLDIRERPERTTMEITIDRDGSMFVAVPAGTPDQPILDFVDRKQDWIHRKRLEKAQFLPSMPRKELVDGEGFRYLGRSYRLLLVDDQDNAVKLSAGRLRLLRQTDRPELALKRWYMTTGKMWVGRRIRLWIDRCGFDGGTVDVRDLGYRWGSLTNPSQINLHWATLQLRPSLIDYVLVHEMMHAMHPAHDDAFWRGVERVLPDFASRRSDLAKTGPSVWLGHTANV